MSESAQQLTEKKKDKAMKNYVTSMIVIMITLMAGIGVGSCNERSKVDKEWQVYRIEQERKELEREKFPEEIISINKERQVILTTPRLLVRTPQSNRTKIDLSLRNTADGQEVVFMWEQESMSYVLRQTLPLSITRFKIIETDTDIEPTVTFHWKDTPEDTSKSYAKFAKMFNGPLSSNIVSATFIIPRSALPEDLDLPASVLQ